MTDSVCTHGPSINVGAADTDNGYEYSIRNEAWLTPRKNPGALAGARSIDAADFRQCEVDPILATVGGEFLEYQGRGNRADLQ